MEQEISIKYFLQPNTGVKIVEKDQRERPSLDLGVVEAQHNSLLDIGLTSDGERPEERIDPTEPTEGIDSNSIIGIGRSRVEITSCTGDDVFEWLVKLHDTSKGGMPMKDIKVVERGELPSIIIDDEVVSCISITSKQADENQEGRKNFDNISIFGDSTNDTSTPDTNDAFPQYMNDKRIPDEGLEIIVEDPYKIRGILKKRGFSEDDSRTAINILRNYPDLTTNGDLPPDAQKMAGRVKKVFGERIIAFSDGDGMTAINLSSHDGVRTRQIRGQNIIIIAPNDTGKKRLYKMLQQTNGGEDLEDPSKKVSLFNTNPEETSIPILDEIEDRVDKAEAIYLGRMKLDEDTRKLAEELEKRGLNLIIKYWDREVDDENKEHVRVYFSDPREVTGHDSPKNGLQEGAHSDVYVLKEETAQMQIDLGTGKYSKVDADDLEEMIKGGYSEIEFFIFDDAQGKKDGRRVELVVYNSGGKEIEKVPIEGERTEKEDTYEMVRKGKIHFGDDVRQILEEGGHIEVVSIGEEGKKPESAGLFLRGVSTPEPDKPLYTVYLSFIQNKEEENPPPDKLVPPRCTISGRASLYERLRDVMQGKNPVDVQEEIEAGQISSFNISNLEQVIIIKIKGDPDDDLTNLSIVSGSRIGSSDESDEIENKLNHKSSSIEVIQINVGGAMYPEGSEFFGKIRDTGGNWKELDLDTQEVILDQIAKMQGMEKEKIRKWIESYLSNPDNMIIIGVPGSTIMQVGEGNGCVIDQFTQVDP